MAATQFAVSYHIHGRVQGVGFRYFTRKQATTLGIRGWVRNQEDGSVLVHASGTLLQLKEFRQVLEWGPRFSEVQRIDEVPLNAGDLESATEFVIVS